MKRSTILAIVGILFVVGAFVVSKKIIANKKKPKSKTEKVVRVAVVTTAKNENIPVKISSNGVLTAKRRLELFAEVEGIFKLSNKLFKPGQNYARGERILNIESSEYYSTVKSAKSDFYNAITAIMPDLRLDYPDMYPKWKEYLSNFDINKTTQELPELINEAERFFISGRGILSAYYNVKNLEKRLSKYNISAPFNGILIETNISEGTLIRQGQKLGEFIDPTSYEMEVNVPVIYSEFMKVNKEVTLSSLNNDKKYKGKVTRVNASINQETQTVSAFVEIKNKDLKEGMFMEASLKGKDIEKAIEIDRSLILDNNQLFIVEENKLTKIDVESVFFSDKKVVVKGVKEGTLVVNKNIPGAYVGMLVEVQNKGVIQ